MQVYALGYAGICVGLRKYMRWAMQVYALSIGGMRGAIKLKIKD